MDTAGLAGTEAGAGELLRPVGSARWAAGLATGALLGLPFGYLLSYLSFLPAMLGLFFFVLFGLVIGAGMYRVWVPLRPMPRGRVLGGVALTTLIAWGGSLVWEGVTFPRQAAKDAIRQVSKPVPGKTPDLIRAEAARDARQFLRERYPPGGIPGYWRWAVTGKHVEIPISGVSRPRPLKLGNTGVLFVVRVILSSVALAGALWAMLKPLCVPAVVRVHGNGSGGDH